MEVGTDYGTVEWTVQNFSCWCHAMHHKVLKSLKFFGKTQFQIHRTKNYYSEVESISIRMLLESCPEVLGDMSLIGPDGHVFCCEEVDFCSKNNRSFEFELKSAPSFDVIKDHLKKKEDFLKDKIIVRFQKRGASNNVLSMQTVILTHEFTHKIVPDEADGFYYREAKHIHTIKFRSSEGILQKVDVYCRNTDFSSKFNFRLKLTGQHESTSIRLHLFQRENKGGAVVQSRVDEVVLSPSQQELETAQKAYLDRSEVSNESTHILLRIRVIPEERSDLPCTYVQSDENTLPTSTVNPPTPNKQVTEKPDAVSFNPSASNKCAEDTSESSKASTSNQSRNLLNVLSKDLMCLYQDQKFSDVTINCSNITFPVHRNILSARSPVFDTMFSTDMKETTSSQVDITDLDPSTLGLFLTFLYRGDVEDLQCDGALNLYYAADKYQVPWLKRECADFLCGSVSASNVCDILTLADKHKDGDLLAVSQNFILDHYGEVLASKEWAEFMERESLLAVKTLTEFGQKKHMVKKA